MVPTEENAFKKILVKKLAIVLDFNFFKHPEHSYALKENLIVRLELNFSEKFTLYSGRGMTAEKEAFYFKLKK